MFMMRQKGRQKAENEKKMVSILERQSEFPALIRECIDEWKGEEADTFLAKVENRVLNLLKYNQYYGIDATRGLNSDRDTEAQVELAIRFFPNLLSAKRGFYPITWQLRSGSTNREFNTKAAAFIPLLAKLAIELNQCEEEERGGLVNGEWSVLMELATRNDYQKDDEKHDQLVNDTCLAVMKRLRGMNLFVKEDIVKYRLITNICCEQLFPEERFRYLADWHPGSLLKPSKYGWIPLHFAVDNSTERIHGGGPRDMRSFQIVLEVGIRYFPIEIGGVFRKNNIGDTPYQMACRKFGDQNVKRAINDAIDLNQRTYGIDTIGALVHTASEQNIHLDGVFLMLKREPSILQNYRNLKKRKPKSSTE